MTTMPTKATARIVVFESSLPWLETRSRFSLSNRVCVSVVFHRGFRDYTIVNVEKVLRSVDRELAGSADISDSTSERKLICIALF